MALHAFMPANSLLHNLLSLVKFPPSSWSHHLPSLRNSVKTSLHFQACLAAKNDQETFRPLANFPPSVWKDMDLFTSNPLLDQRELESYYKKIEQLKEKVKGMLMASTNDLAQKVVLVDSICRLGMSYHFETEIEEILGDIFEAQPKLLDDNDYDIYTVAILFRVLRQHGYKMSSDVFNKFKDSNGKFKETLTSDVRGLLSLYEATHLRIHGEDILEEALAFTTAHLSSWATKTNPHLTKQVISALERPLHKGMARVESRQYISFYEEDGSRNETLLILAKLEFNRVQLLHQLELSCIKSWWRDLNFASKLPYARDRIVELYFWMVGIFFEPCYSRARIISTKVLKLFSVMDDTFDAYGTLEELEQFKMQYKRSICLISLVWDTSALDQLPDYMKVLYEAILNLFKEMDDDVIKEGRSYSVSYTKEALKEIVRAYLVEIQWFHEDHVPLFEEYLSNALITAGYSSMTTALFVGMGEIAGVEAFKWLQSKPKIVDVVYAFGRLIDDIESHQFEQTRGHVASGVECYMKQYGTSRKETIEKFKRMFGNYWKDMNEECLKPTTIPMQLLIRVVNIARIVEVTYNGKDRYTNPEHLKSYITTLFFDQIPI